MNNIQASLGGMAGEQINKIDPGKIKPNTAQLEYFECNPLRKSTKS